ncbi:MAG: glycosyltransferase family 2 protein [Desulfovibrionales bacterium]|nr:MAG: glycosyltransferase family 2 protein [Desulfovibrionales bacterium]
MTAELPRVSIAVINYNGIARLEHTLSAIDHLSYPDVAEVVVIDDGSTDGSQEMVVAKFPNFRLVELGQNQGAAAARNRALAEAGSELIFLLDNDIVVEPDCLSHLIRVKQKLSHAGAVHPTIIDQHDPRLSTHYNGGYIHYLCAYIPKTQTENDYAAYDVVSGGALLLEKTLSLRIGGFDEAYVFNWEDGDFLFRLTLAGHPCINVAAAKVLHTAAPRGTSKAFFQVRNRWFFIIKMYSWRTLVLSAPALFIFECSQFLFLLAKGAGREYVAGTWAATRQFPDLLRKRRHVQQLKVVRDRDVFHSGDLYVPPQLLTNPLLKILKRGYVGFFNFYWLLIRKLV